MELEQRLKIAKKIVNYRQKNIPKINKDILNDEVIIGLLLSDGHISRQRTVYSNSNFSISIGSKYMKFAEYVESYLKKLGTNVYKKEYLRKTGIKHFNIVTSKDPKFTELRKIWYPNGYKIVPRNLVLTPKITAWWFMGDGTSNWYVRGNKKVRMEFASESFSYDENLFLVNLLVELGVKGMKLYRVKKKEQFRIRCKRSEPIAMFMKMIEPHIHEDFNYKIKHPYVKSKTGPDSLWKLDKSKLKCLVENCSRSRDRKKLICTMHRYSDLPIETIKSLSNTVKGQIKTGSKEFLDQLRSPCNVVGCNNRCLINKLTCVKHIQRDLSIEFLKTLPKSRQAHTGLYLWMTDPSRKKCTVESCNRTCSPKRNVCYQH